MNKEEILQKAKNTKSDEREQSITVKSSSFGGIAVTIIIGIFMIINSIKGKGVSDLLSILLTYWSVQYFYQYKQLGRKMFLIIGCTTSIGFLCAVASYIIWG